MPSPSQHPIVSLALWQACIFNLRARLRFPYCGCAACIAKGTCRLWSGMDCEALKCVNCATY